MPSTSLTDCHPYLRERWARVEAEFPYALRGARGVILTCTWRDPVEQQILFKIGREFNEDGSVKSVQPGRIVTGRDGVSTLSEHNKRPSRALDFAVTVAGKVTWDPAEYLPIGVLAEKHGLTWGGRWKMPRDYPHVEVPTGVA